MLAVLMVRTAHGDVGVLVRRVPAASTASRSASTSRSARSAPGLACLAALLVTAAMVFSWRYFEEVSTYYHALMLTFLAGMAGFCLTGDIFDLFVWFELMGVSAYALTAYRPEERGPLQGALNFAITNSVGAYLSLSGIALIYGRTGALNMAQIGRDIARHRPDGLVVVAFLLIIAGLLIKGSIVPFHFWLADAHAVAPTPVCVLFSGVMVELGLYGIARVYWSVFGYALGHRGAITGVFLALGLLTAVVGALFCFRERHLKRLLAFSTISHAGHVPGRHRAAHAARAGRRGRLRGRPRPAEGGAVPVRGHRPAPPRLGQRDVAARAGPPAAGDRGGVHAGRAGAGRPAPVRHLPGQGLDRGERQLARGMAWIAAVFIIASVLVGGAVLRVAGGVFYGLGDPPSEDPQMAREASEETSETERGKRRTPLSMIVPAALLVLAAVAVTVLPRLGPDVQAAAVRFQDQAAYNSTVLSGAHVAHPAAIAAPEDTGITVADVATGAGSAAGGARARLPRAVLAAAAAAPPRVRAGDRPGRADPAFPERRDQRLRDVDRRRPGLSRRRPGLRHPVTGPDSSPGQAVTRR